MSESIVRVRNLTHLFRLNRRFAIKAVNNVSFDIYKGEILGLIGESGSGKSTIARCLMNIHKPNSGEIFYKGINSCNSNEFAKNRHVLQTGRQLIFQDSASSLNQRMRSVDIITEPMRIHNVKPKRGSYRAEASWLLSYVGLDDTYLDKYPAEMSGGQRQRIAIARALSMEPELLVADEPIASLDVSIQAQIVNLFKHLREEHGFTILFIAHDLSMVRYLCDRIGVMYRGTLVELAETSELFANPCHPYTRLLLSAIPLPDPLRERNRPPINTDDVLFNTEGSLSEVCPGHFVLG